MFHVYVEGVTGTAPDAVRSLAETMATRYGLPAAELQARLSKGRFRVKANVDQETANTYARDLEAIGARVRIEDALAAAPSARAATPSAGFAAPSARAATPSTEPAAPSARAATPSVRTSPAVVRRVPTPTPASNPAETALPLARGPSPRPALSALPPQPELRPALSALPPQPESRPTQSTLPPQPASRATRPSLPPQPASRPTTGPLPAHLASRPTRPSLPPQLASRPTTGPLPAHLASRPSVSALPPQPSRPTRTSLPAASALDAAQDRDDPAASGSLGALDGDGLLSLESLDGGSPDAPMASGGRWDAGPTAAPGASAHPIGTPARPARPIAPARPRDEPVDMFAPPDAAEADEIVELADDELEHRARKRQSAPPPVAAEPSRPTDPLRRDAEPSRTDTSGARPRPSSPVLGSPPVPKPSTSSAQPTAASPGPTSSSPSRPHASSALPRTWTAAQLARLAEPRRRLAAGVLLAIMLGFVPAYIVAAARETSAFRAIDAKVIAVQTAADSEATYEALDSFRAAQLRDKRSARRMIALTSMLIWAAAGSGLAYAWFKRVPWDRLG